MKNVLFAGSGGFVGTALIPELRARGHLVTRLVREPEAAQANDAALWLPEQAQLDPRLVNAADVVINLCGRNIGGSRWTPGVKEELRSSRLLPTQLLSQAIASATSPPSLLINASATGYYGDCGEEQLDESSGRGSGFLAELADDWESAATAARSSHTRVAALRLGMVVGSGGALTRMLPLFRLGLGGPLGSGRQWWPWIALADVAGIITGLAEHPGFDGPLNLVAPQQLRCRDFSRKLGRFLHRPAVLPAPAAALRMMLGEMAEALLLASARVTSTVLGDELGYDFRAATLEDALAQALN